MPARLQVDNSAARRLFLSRHGLLDRNAGGTRLLELIENLGFVQIDSISRVERAHHMILFSRSRNYRQESLRRLLEDERTLFEHWTHDASVIPTRFFPYWRHRFDRDRARLRDRWRSWQGSEYEHGLERLLRRIRDEGPLASRDVAGGARRSSSGWWDWHPSKTALEYLWRVGELAITRRESFRKVYDLTERVIPAACLGHRPESAEAIAWACGAAMDRLGLATSGEIAAFWALASPEEAAGWARSAVRDGNLVPADVQMADGRVRRMFARPEALAQAKDLTEPRKRIRILSPFDPAIRDRNRTERLFGFHFRIEIFVPEKKRRFGYYVFPLLEGDRLIGRIDMQSRRDAGCLMVHALWPEPGNRFGRGRLRQLESELSRIAAFSGCDRFDFAAGWLREA